MAQKRRAEAVWIDSRARWQINVQRDGKRKTFTSTIPGRKGKHEAEGKADDWLEAGQPDDIRFNNAWEMYLDHLSKTTGLSNYTDNKSIGRTWLLPALGDKRISRIRLSDVQFIMSAAAEKGLAKRTCKNIRDKLSGFLVWATDNKISHSIDCTKVKIPQTAKEATRTVVQPEQLRSLFSAKPTSHYIYGYQLIVCLGLRSGELCGLKESDYDGTTLSICRSINRLDQITPGKTINARRTIVLPQRAKTILAEQKAFLQRKGIKSTWLFPDTLGEHTNPHRVNRSWRTFAESQGITSSIHELRHTFISMTNKDLPSAMLKLIVGHSDKMPTDDVYGHEIDGDKQRAADIIDAVLDKHLAGE